MFGKRQPALLRPLLLLLIVSLMACPAWAGDKTFMWKVQSKSAVAYILGSVHFAREDVYPLDRRITGAFEKADALVVEFDTAAMDQAELQRLILRDAVYGPGDDVRKHVSKETFVLMKQKFDELGIPVENLLKFKPWFLGITLTVAGLEKAGYNSEQGIDMHFLKRARGAKRIVELESADFQMRLLKSFEEYDQELFLIDSMKYSDRLEQLMDSVLKAWKSGDAATMEKLSFQSVEEEPRLAPLYDKLFFARNKDMTDKIEEMLKTPGTYFVVVGAGHLVGEKGIARALAARGYAVSQE